MPQPKPLKAERPSYDRSDLPDKDGDGLSDEFERDVLGTKPNRRDSDGDGLTDLEERAYGTDPTKWSSDADGLSDKQEYDKGTNPWMPDSDFDDFPDHLDRRPLSRVDPENNGRHEYWDRLGTETKRDEDGDSLNNIEERWLRTDGWNKDSDGDTIDDRDEVHLRSNPRDPAKTPVSSAEPSPDSSLGDELAGVYIGQPAVDTFFDPAPPVDETASGEAALDFSASAEPADDPHFIDALDRSDEVDESRSSFTGEPAVYIEQPAVEVFVDPATPIDDAVSGHPFDFSAAAEPVAEAYDMDAFGCGGEAGEL